MQQDIWARIVTMTRIDYDNAIAAARREGYQTAMLEMQQAQSVANDQWQKGFDAGTKARKATPEYLSNSYPSDYQLRLERYAVDIFCREGVYTVGDSVNFAYQIMALAAEKAANQ